MSRLSCNPCSPDEIRGGSQCNPCNPCSPDQLRGGSQCNPCNPCSPDQLRGGTQCNPCNPCSPDQIRGGSQCNPCNPCSPDQMAGGNSGSDSSCFITSACVESLGLPDDCDELQTLRKFRDKRKLIDSAFAELVKEYYEIAPDIVNEIDFKQNAKKIYEELYKDLVLPCVEYIKNGDEEAAITLYTKIVRALQAQYGGSNRKYKISSHCRFVKGACSSAIYDLRSGEVFSLNADDTHWLEDALENKVTEDMKEFLDGLCANKFLNCTEFGNFKFASSNKLSLRYVWLELTNRCNSKCIHCYGAFGLPTCEDLKRELSLEDWKEILKQIKQYGGNAIQFIGGEPLVFPGFCDLLKYAHNIGIENIDIFTNGTLLTEEIIEVIKLTGACVRVSLYGYDDESHEKITQFKGSFLKLDHALDLLKEKDIPTQISVVMMEENQNDLEKIVEYIERKGHIYSGFDTVRRVRHSLQNSHAVTDTEIKKYRHMTEPAFFTSCLGYEKNRNWNSCWYGKLAITATGDVIPCIFARDRVCGNIKNDSEEIIKGKLISYWGINKDKVKVCKDCEYRYACDDCRPLADGETGDVYSKYPRCLYDPYTGTWGDLG